MKEVALGSFPLWPRARRPSLLTSLFSRGAYFYIVWNIRYDIALVTADSHSLHRMSHDDTSLHAHIALLSYSAHPIRKECRWVVLVIVIVGASLCDAIPPSIVAPSPTASNLTRNHSPRRLVPSLLMLMMSTHSYSSRRSSPKRC